MDKLLERLHAVTTKTNTDDAKDVFSGQWKNQLKSKMSLVVSVEGQVTGKYITAVGDPDQRESALVGFASNDIITFTVNFGRSLATWSGQLEKGQDGQEKLVTLWHLIVNTEEGNEKDWAWKDTYTGSDQFIKL